MHYYHCFCPHKNDHLQTLKTCPKNPNFSLITQIALKLMALLCILNNAHAQVQNHKRR